MWATDAALAACFTRHNTKQTPYATARKLQEPPDAGDFGAHDPSSRRRYCFTLLILLLLEFSARPHTRWIRACAGSANRYAAQYGV